ncbi:type I 3-dehydroquinate dehydratase [Brevibacterium yomogidense]|uniref:type I 3-dehydroquinate dehydratase n=1 Tax=Brevibacterium yomogidense TaxID=946573 RepID=UPI0018DF7440|nr:type I 3-dehydroquinate dehydratase [Brevibacterium yomogidense]
MKPLPFAPRALPAIIVPILARTGDDAARQAIAVSSHEGVDVLEWRIDPLVVEAADSEQAGVSEQYGGSAWDADLARSYGAFARTRIPTLVTVRSEAEGGHCPVERYTEAVEAAIALRPAAVDVEMGREESARLLEAAKEAGVATVVSAHSWEATPSSQQLDTAFAVMASSGADVVKIAVMPHSMEDVLTLLGATARASQAHEVPVIGIAMGELGRVTRLCAGEFGSAATFATVGAGSAPGQMTAEQVDLVRSILLRG